MDSIVIVIPPEFGVEPLEQYWQPAVTVFLTPRGEALERGPECLPCGPALEVCSPLALLAPPNLAPQKLTPGFRIPLAMQFLADH